MDEVAEAAEGVLEERGGALGLHPLHVQRVHEPVPAAPRHGHVGVHGGAQGTEGRGEGEAGLGRSRSLLGHLPRVRLGVFAEREGAHPRRRLFVVVLGPLGPTLVGGAAAAAAAEVQGEGERAAATRRAAVV